MWECQDSFDYLFILWSSILLENNIYLEQDKLDKTDSSADEV